MKLKYGKQEESGFFSVQHRRVVSKQYPFTFILNLKIIGLHLLSVPNIIWLPH